MTEPWNFTEAQRGQFREAHAEAKPPGRQDNRRTDADPDVAALQKRLEAAERVCVLYGWTAGDDSERGKALHELWSEWVDLVGGAFTGPDAHPELSDERITELARRRDETRERTLARIREQGA